MTNAPRPRGCVALTGATGFVGGHLLRRLAADGWQLRALRRRADRKSVVEGKSVSVRVDVGGRRIIKKKKNTRQRLHRKSKCSSLKSATHINTIVRHSSSLHVFHNYTSNQHIK